MKKIWIVGIVIPLLIIPVTSAIYVPNNADRISREKQILEPLDNEEEEIVSRIYGSCEDTSFYGIGVFYNVEIFATSNTGVSIHAYTSLLPQKSYYIRSGNYVKAPIFIGYTFKTSPGEQHIRGIALGNIEWS